MQPIYKPFKIGPHVIETPFLLAPMAGVSEMPYRVLAFAMGAGLATTELISAKGIFYKNRRTRHYLTYDAVHEKPYSVQLFGGEIESMALAAKAAYENGADIVDINMGCPVKKVTKTGAGSALMCNPAQAEELVKAMRKATDDKIPITVKIRAGWDDSNINCVEMAKRLEGAGCMALALHARTRAQGYTGQAHWKYIYDVKNAVSMPIIGNGDVASVKDAHRMFAETGCDGVMVGRAALGNPWIFQMLKDGADRPVGARERQKVIVEHWHAHMAFHKQLNDEDAAEHGEAEYTEPEVELHAIRAFRQHLLWYSHGMRGKAEFRRIATQIDSADEMLLAVEKFFGDPIHDLAPPDETQLGSANSLAGKGTNNTQNMGNYSSVDDVEDVNYQGALG